MTSIAVEFHIYFFVGALYFLCIGRQRKFAAVIAICSATMPLGYFQQFEARALFLLWLMGFAIYFVVRSIRIDGDFVTIFAVTVAGILYFWRPFANVANVYDIANFPAIALCFAALVVVTQCYRMLAANITAAKLVHLFASYSLTLFLVHLTIIRTIFEIWPHPAWLEFLVAIIAANLFSLAFSRIGEVRYKRAADWIMGAFRWPQIAPAE